MIKEKCFKHKELDKAGFDCWAYFMPIERNQWWRFQVDSHCAMEIDYDYTMNGEIKNRIEISDEEFLEEWGILVNEINAMHW